MPKVEVVYFLHHHSPQITYVVTDVATRQSAVINPVVIFLNGQINYAQVDEAVAYLETNNLSLDWILDTHFDPYQYLAGRYLQQRLGGVRGISEMAKRSIKSLPGVNSSLFNYEEYFLDGELFLLGHIQTQVVWVPSFSPCCVSYVVSDCIFSGNCLNLPEEGVTHCLSSPTKLSTHYESIHKLFTFPNDYKLYVGNVRQRELPLSNDPSCSVWEQKRCNRMSNVTLNFDAFCHALNHQTNFEFMENIQLSCANVVPYLTHYN